MSEQDEGVLSPYWIDDKNYPSLVWKFEVQHEETRLGYWDWVVAQKRIAAEKKEE